MSYPSPIDLAAKVAVKQPERIEVKRIETGWVLWQASKAIRLFASLLEAEEWAEQDQVWQWGYVKPGHYIMVDLSSSRIA